MKKILEFLLRFSTHPLSPVFRTASVTGVVIEKYMELRKDTITEPLTVGIIGLGPIGQLHLQMMDSILGDQVKEYLVYDLYPDLIDNVDSSIAQ